MSSAIFDSTLADEINEGLKRLFGKRAARATVVMFDPPLDVRIDTSGHLAFEIRRIVAEALAVCLSVFLPFFFRAWKEREDRLGLGSRRERFYASGRR